MPNYVRLGNRLVNLDHIVMAEWYDDPEHTVELSMLYGARIRHQGHDGLRLRARLEELDREVRPAPEPDDLPRAERDLTDRLLIREPPSAEERRDAGA